MTQVMEESGLANKIADYAINMARQRAPGASMNKETWQSISEDGKAVWAKLSNRDKQKILQYAMKRVSPKEPVSINQVTSQRMEDFNEQKPNDEPGEHPMDSEEMAEVEVNKTVSKA